jgi:acyl-CoA synthetase (AMP-forming)/AMP-acid ligase II
MPPTYNVAKALRLHAAQRPQAPALAVPSADYRTDAPRWNTWTYAELDQQSDALAYGLTDAGVRAGDRTLVLIRPSHDLYATLFALFKIGAVPVLLDPGMGPRALLTCIERNEPRVIIALSAVHAVRTVVRRPFRSAEVFVTVGRRWFWGGTTLDACRQPRPEPFPLAERAADDDAAILFTSGSTGAAKGVASKQAMFAAQVEALRDMFGFLPGQKDVQAFAGFAIFDLCLGMTSILPKADLSKPAKALPEDIIAAIHAHAADVTFASPIIWQHVSRYAAAQRVQLPSVRTLLTVGAPIPPYLHRRFQTILTGGAQVWTPYGATEAMPLTWIGTDELLADCVAQTAAGRGTCVGRVVPGVTLKVIAVTDDPVDEVAPNVLPLGQIGEIVALGDVVSPAYTNAPDANRLAKIHDSEGTWHRMGDLGSFDEHGRLWFCGRKAHRLQTANGMVAGDPVEGVFNEHPDVFRTALVGVGASGDEIPVLIVEMEPGRTFDDEVRASLLDLARGTPHEGLVQHVWPHPGFPVDARHNSKIRREDLRVWAAARWAKKELA